MIARATAPAAASTDERTFRDPRSTVSEDVDFETVVGLLDDAYAREILAATSTEPMSASDLADHCDASRQTMYRRLDRLQDAGLVAERTRPREDGHHDAVYVATLRSARVVLREGSFEFECERDEPDMADELTRLWGEL